MAPGQTVSAGNFTKTTKKAHRHIISQLKHELLGIKENITETTPGRPVPTRQAQRTPLPPISCLRGWSPVASDPPVDPRLLVRFLPTQTPTRSRPLPLGDSSTSNIHDGTSSKVLGWAPKTVIYPSVIQHVESVQDQSAVRQPDFFRSPTVDPRMLYFQDADPPHELLEAEDTKPYIAHSLPTEGNELEQHPVPAIEIQQSSDASETTSDDDKSSDGGQDQPELETQNMAWGMPIEKYRALTPAQKKQVRNIIGARRFRDKRKAEMATLQEENRRLRDRLQSLESQISHAAVRSAATTPVPGTSVPPSVPASAPMPQRPVQTHRAHRLHFSDITV